MNNCKMTAIWILESSMHLQQFHLNIKSKNKNTNWVVDCLDWHLGDLRVGHAPYISSHWVPCNTRTPNKRFFTLASDARRDSSVCSKTHLRIVQLGPLNPKFFPKDVIKFCITSFMVINEHNNTSSPSTSIFSYDADGQLGPCASKGFPLLFDIYPTSLFLLSFVSLVFLLIF